MAGNQQNGSSLTLTQLLQPPSKSIGQGPSTLNYSSQSPAWHCTFSRNGDWLAACYGAPDPCIRVWRKNEQNNQYVLHSTLEGVHERTIRCAAFAPLSSSSILAVASFDGSVSIWEYEKGTNSWECTTQLEGHDNEVKYVAWNATGSLLATCGRDKT
jgi:WD40 repeat protein